MGHNGHPNFQFAEVVRVYDSPGDGGDMRWDVIAWGEGESPQFFERVRTWLPVPGDSGAPDDLQYDVIGAGPQTPVEIHMVGGEVRFKIPWRPYTGRCPNAARGGGGGGGRRRPPLDEPQTPGLPPADDGGGGGLPGPGGDLGGTGGLGGQGSATR